MLASVLRRAGLTLGTTTVAAAAVLGVVPPAAAATNPTIRVFDATLTEGTGGQAIVAFAVQLSKPATKTITLTWGTYAAGSTRASAGDYTAVPSGTKKSIAKGSSSTVLIVKVNADVIDEYSETFGVRIAGASGAMITDATATATIIDDDVPPLLVVSTPLVVEGAAGDPGLRPVSVGLSQPSGKPVSVRVAVTGGTASVGSDLVGGTKNVVFPPGAIAAVVDVDVVGDSVDEANEAFALTWAAPVNVRLPSRSTAKTLLDDDGPLVPRILGSTPLAPSPDPEPLLFGLMPARYTVNVYGDASCTGPVIDSGSAADFITTGFAVSMSSNVTNTLTVRGVDGVGGADTVCSAPFTYRHDDSAPTAPSNLEALPGSPTQSVTPAVRGSVETGTSVSVYVGSACTGTPVVTSTAADFEDGDGLPLGTLAPNATYSIQVAATDAAGNVGACSATLAITIDTLGPAVPTGLTVLPSAVTTDTTPALQGDAETGSTVEIFVDEACDSSPHDTGSASVFGGASGIALSSALSDGDHDLRARAVDLAGNLGDCSAPVVVTIDTAGPADPNNLVVLPGPLTNDDTPALRGDIEAGSTVQIWLGAGCSGPSDASGSRAAFASGIAVPALADGSYQLWARATDSALNVSGCAGPELVTVDTVRPAAPTGLSVLPGAVTSDPTPALQGTTAEVGSTIEVFVDNACTGAVRGSGSRSLFLGAGITIAPALLEDSYSLYARALDGAGNDGFCSAAEPVTIDLTGPAEPTGLTVPDGTPTNSPAVRGQVPADAVTVTIFRGGSCLAANEVGSGSAAQFEAAQGIPVTVSDGPQIFKAMATDALGLDSACSSDSVTVTVDTAAPAAPTGLSIVPGTPTNDVTPALSGTAESGSVVHLFVDDLDCSGTNAAIDDAATFATPIGIPLDVALAENTYQLTATATDSAGNESACSAAETVVVDLTDPAAPTIDLIPDDPGANPFAKGNVEAGSTVSVYLNGDCSAPPIDSVTASVFNSPGVALGSLPAGSYSVTARARDAAGNLGPCSASEDFVVT